MQCNILEGCGHYLLLVLVDVVFAVYIQVCMHTNLHVVITICVHNLTYSFSCIERMATLTWGQFEEVFSLVYSKEALLPYTCIYTALPTKHH